MNLGPGFAMLPGHIISEGQSASGDGMTAAPLVLEVPPDNKATEYSHFSKQVRATFIQHA
jgi:hypothetical protein